MPVESAVCSIVAPPNLASFPGVGLYCTRMHVILYSTPRVNRRVCPMVTYLNLVDHQRSKRRDYEDYSVDTTVNAL